MWHESSDEGSSSINLPIELNIITANQNASAASCICVDAKCKVAMCSHSHHSADKVPPAVRSMSTTDPDACYTLHHDRLCEPA